MHDNAWRAGFSALSGTRHISLFGGKYQGDFEEPKECDAFAKGVEAVLNHMAETSEEKSESNEAA